MVSGGGEGRRRRPRLRVRVNGVITMKSIIHSLTDELLMFFIYGNRVKIYNSYYMGIIV